MAELRMTADEILLVSDEWPWPQPLTGIRFGEWRMGYGEGNECDIYLRDISDATLSSLRLLRDELSGVRFIIHSD